MQTVVFIATVSPASCEVRAMIPFLCGQGSSAAGIQRKVGQWCRSFKNCRTNMHDEEWNSRSCIQIDGMVEHVNRKLQLSQKSYIINCANGGYKPAQRAKNAQWTSVVAPLSTRWRRLETTVNAVVTFNFTRTQNVQAISLLESFLKWSTITAVVYYEMFINFWC